MVLGRDKIIKKKKRQSIVVTGRGRSSNRRARNRADLAGGRLGGWRSILEFKKKNNLVSKSWRTFNV